MKQRISKILALLLVLVTLLGNVIPAHAAGETVERFAYDGENVTFIKKDGSGFGMFAPQEGTTAVINGDNVEIHYVPNKKTTYGWLHFGAITDEELTKDVTFNEDGTFDITLSKSDCGWAIPVAPIKLKDGATTGDQYYLAIPTEDKLEDVTPAPVVERFAYDGENVTFIKKDGSGFGMFAPQEGTTAVINGDNVEIHYVPNKKTTYGWLHFGAITDEELTKDVTFNEDGSFDITLPKSDCGWAIPVAPIKLKDGATTGDQYYLAIPAEDKLEDVTPEEGERVDLVPTNEELMFKVVNAYLKTTDGKTEIVYALSGKGYKNVIAGTYEEAISASAGGSHASWISYIEAEVDCDYWTDRAIDDPSLQHHQEGVNSKYQFSMPVKDLPHSGTVRIPVVAISDSRATAAEKADPENPDYSAAFTARQLLVDLDSKTVRIGNYQDTMEASVVSHVETFPVKDKGIILTIGTPQANEYTVQTTFTMKDGTYDLAFVGTIEDAAAEDAAVMAIGEDNSFTIWLQNSLGKTPEFNIETKKADVAFHVAADDSWIIRTLTIDAESGTITIDGEELPADYSAVDAAIAAVPADLSIYTEESVKVLNDAVDAVIRNLPASSQAMVDAMAKAIEDAIAALVEDDADYTAVDAALAKVPADLSIYTDSSAARLDSAVKAVKRGLKKSEQSRVDDMAKAIEDAIRDLVKLGDADYAAVNAALDKVPADLSIYTEESARAVTDAVSAVERGLNESQQARVDAMAQAIEDAVANLVELDADYTAVDAALAKVPADLSIYTEETAQAVTEAVNAVERGLKKGRQADVDEMARNIEEAIAALTEADADYTAVDAALDKVPADLTVYTEESAQAVANAVNTVKRGLKKSRQADVDAMAKAIEDAIAALELKPVDPVGAFDNSTEVPDGEYQVPEDDFTWTGGTGKAGLTLVKVIVKNGKAVGIFHATSSNMTHAYLGKTESNEEDPRYYDPETDTMGANVYLIENQSVTLPIRINETVDVSCRTVAMSEPHWVNYQYLIHIDGEKPGPTEPSDPVEPVEEDADYTAVDAALAKISADLSVYTADSVQALLDARDAVERGLKQSRQTEVDAMARAIENAIASLVLKPVDGRMDLEIVNTTGMFKALFAYVLTENGHSTLVVALTGSSYHYLYRGNYAQAVANGDDRSNWVQGYQNETEKWLFDLPLDDGETYIPVVSVSNTYLEKYEDGQNPLERAFFPRQFVLDMEAAVLTVGDYDETVTATVESRLDTFRVAQTAQMRVVGGPNSNNFRVMPVLQMLDDTYDQVTYPTVDGGKLTKTTAALGEDMTFVIDMLNAPNLFAFRDKEPVALQFRVKSTGETVTVWLTIDLLANSITVESEGQPVQGAHKYEFVVGGNGSWTKGSEEPMLLTVKSITDDEGTFARFVGVEVDGRELDSACYEATAGSVNISLKADYLDTLSESVHTITVKMIDASVSTTFTISPAGSDTPVPGGEIEAPDTGDVGVTRWAVLMVVSAAALTAVLLEKKRRVAR